MKPPRLSYSSCILRSILICVYFRHSRRKAFFTAKSSRGLGAVCAGCTNPACLTSSAVRLRVLSCFPASLSFDPALLELQADAGLCRCIGQDLSHSYISVNVLNCLKKPIFFSNTTPMCHCPLFWDEALFCSAWTFPAATYCTTRLWLTTLARWSEPGPDTRVTAPSNHKFVM